MPRQTAERTNPPKWPSVKEQLDQAKATPGSALERFIRDNQDFDLLPSEEVHDNLGYPPWLRVYWRKAHPDARGYPATLNRLHAWLLTHPPQVRGICRLFYALRRVRVKLFSRQTPS